MKNIGLIIVFFAIANLSCQHNYKECKNAGNDETLNIYNLIIDDFIRFGSYDFYLGEDEERIFRLRAHNEDSAEIEQEVIKLHNDLFGDSSKQCTVYLDTFFRMTIPAFDSVNLYRYDSVTAIELKKLNPGIVAVLDSLNTLQTNYKPDDFKTCVAKIKSITDTANENCQVGRVAFSNLFLDKSGSMGVVGLQFRCGFTCGYGALIYFKLEDGEWKITDKKMLWIS